MKNRAEILNELKELGSPLAGFPVRMPFGVPDSYFINAPEHLASGTLAAEATADPHVAFPRTFPFTVPEGYFDTLPSYMLQIAQFEEEEEAVLPQIGEAFSVPAGYFDNLAGQLLAKAKESDVTAPVITADRKPSRTIPMPSFRPVLRWAAAAIMLLGVGFGGYRAMQQQEISDISGQLAKLDKKELYQYVQQNIDDFDEDAMISVASINTKAGTAPAIDMDLDLEEQEIIDFLDQNGWDAEDTINEL